MILHIDIETYSSVSIGEAGAYKYVESTDFEILLIAYAFDNEPVQLVDLAQGYVPDGYFLAALADPLIKKHAHNANFERIAFRRIGYDIPAKQWVCSAIKATYCGFPLALGQVSKAMNLEEKGKLSTGKALIKYFCMPCKPTKVNGGRLRNLPGHVPDKWLEFIDYCKQDVEAEREISNLLNCYELPESERLNYILDQQVNDQGVKVDLNLAKNAHNIDLKYSEYLNDSIKNIAHIDNPNSLAQLKKWIFEVTGKEIQSLTKDTIEPLINKFGPGPVSDVLGLRKQSGKTSVKKYTKILESACEDSRVRGLLQFYGANRTGRWAGRLVQVQNLPQNHLDDLQGARDVISRGDYKLATMLYDDIPSLLSQLIRTTFVAKKGHIFAVADFSAIEARVIAWLAQEQWRIDVFNSHGKIYEASASVMFNIPIEEVTKEIRQTGKVAELALGYQGAVGALESMCKTFGIEMGYDEMRSTVDKWRLKSPAIVQLWRDLETAAKRALKTRAYCVYRKGSPQELVFHYDGKALTIKLPSGRKLFYQSPSFTINKFGQESIQYRGMNQTTKQWEYTDTYGGKIVENIVQAIARDLLADAMRRLDSQGFNVVMHVHDEAVCEEPTEHSESDLKEMCHIMAEENPWAPGLRLPVDGFLTPFYKK